MKVIFGILLVLLLPCAYAATIEGNVYDFDLTPTNGAVVKIDTTPQQQVVAINSSYSINVPEGSYTLTASKKMKGKVQSQINESIIVDRNGTYTLDLILFPVFTGDETIDADVDFTGTDITEPTDTTAIPWTTIAIIGGVLIAGLSLWFWLARKAEKQDHPKQRKEQPSEKDVLDDLVAAIKKQGGRTTQKELRKDMPYSEAKISLMLTELEHNGRITKIKRGRSNIVILKQR
jgi:uncharacterized membrane protein